MPTVALFGCGLVAPPILRYFNRIGVKQIIATRNTDKAKKSIVKLLKRPELVELISCDVTRDPHMLACVVSRSDVVASVLPASQHYPVLQQCVQKCVPAVTPSIAADANAGTLDESAKLAGVLLLTECGQSPGLDHMDTLRLAARAHAVGGKVRGYTSLAGSLATAEGIRNPLGAKLTWSPRDWLMHSWHSARYLEDGLPVDVPWNELYLPQNIGSDDYPSLGKVAWFVNRDTIKHLEMYGLMQDALNAKRGVHDYLTIMPFLRAVQHLGLTSLKPMKGLSKLSYLEFCQQAFQETDVRESIHTKLGTCNGLNAGEIINMLEYIGLFSSCKVPEGPKCALEVVAEALGKITIKAGEPDSAVNRQIMQVELTNGSWEEWRSTIEVYGEFLGTHDDSAAAKLTGLTIAVAGRLLLEGKIPKDLVGVNAPTFPEIYMPIMNGLEELGISCQESRITRRNIA